MTIEVTDADVEAVEAIIGTGSAAWDCVGPKKIIAAALEVMRKKEAMRPRFVITLSDEQFEQLSNRSNHLTETLVYKGVELDVIIQREGD